MMAVRIIAPPAEMPVSLADARSHARVNGTDMDSDIEVRVRALAAEAEHYTGRVIINRTYRVTLPSFPARIELPASPVAAVSGIEFVGEDGFSNILDPSAYVVDDSSEPGYIDPASGVPWPATQADRSNAVTVTVVCGYGDDESTTPAAFKGFILAKVKEYFAPAGTPESPHLIHALDSLVLYK